jgi:hypothetical protein
MARPAKARLRAVRPQLDAVPGPYQITKRLPAAEDGEFQVRDQEQPRRVQSDRTRERADARLNAADEPLSGIS